MPDPQQIPYLLRLLEDDSPEVRDAVMGQFAAFGSSLEDHLEVLGSSLREQHRLLIDGLLRVGRRKLLREQLVALDPLTDDKMILEAGLQAVSVFLQRPRSADTVSRLLDDLAREFRESQCEKDVFALSEFLFHTKHLRGARNTYYNPQNSNLMYVLVKGQGLPISLACIYILVASRCGLRVEGCNLPGHFLALGYHHGKRFVVDCYNGGVVLLDSDLARLSSVAPVNTSDLGALECRAQVILARVLRNIANALRRIDDENTAEDAEAVENILQQFSPPKK